MNKKRERVESEERNSAFIGEKGEKIGTVRKTHPAIRRAGWEWTVSLIFSESLKIICENEYEPYAIPKKKRGRRERVRWRLSEKSESRV